MAHPGAGKLPPPLPDIAERFHPSYLAAAQASLSYSAVGSPETVERKLREIITDTGVDELILTGHMYEHKARLRSFEIAAGLAGKFDSNTSGLSMKNLVIRPERRDAV